MKVNLEHRISVCRDCFSRVKGTACLCGGADLMRMNPMTHQIMLTLEGMDAPIHTVDLTDYVDAEFIKAAGVV